MSNLNEYALIIATFISGGFLIVYVTKLQNDAVSDIITGVFRGVPVSTEMRWIWLFQVFVGMAMFVAIVDFFLMFAFLKIAATMAGDVQWLAYLGAGATGFAFVTQILFGTSAGLKLAAILRQSRRE